MRAVCPKGSTMPVSATSSASDVQAQWQLMRREHAAQSLASMQTGKAPGADAAGPVADGPPPPPPGSRGASPPDFSDASSATADSTAPTHTGSSITKLLTDLRSFLLGLQSETSPSSAAGTGAAGAAPTTATDAASATTASSSDAGSSSASSLVSDLNSVLGNLESGAEGQSASSVNHGHHSGPPPPSGSTDAPPTNASTLEATATSTNTAASVANSDTVQPSRHTSRQFMEAIRNYEAQSQQTASSETIGTIGAIA